MAVGFIIRLFFISNSGFQNDVQSFESWALTLGSHPLWQFYAKAGFADYPPGYFYILWIVGHIYAPLQNGDPSYAWLRFLIKLPAIVMDLVNTVLIYAIVRRFADQRYALGAAALYILNPAVIFISAAWGQVDSVAGGFALAAIYLLIVAADVSSDGTRTRLIVFAWLAIAYSILIKPQAAILVPLLITYTFVAPEQRMSRLRGLAGGVIGTIALAWLLALPFHPQANPISVLGWLYERYVYGTGVYAVNSVNAFNLWTINYPFWQADTARVLFLPQFVWGLLLLAAAVVLVLIRYAQAPTRRALLESAALLALAFFMLSTRMHERYIFNGLLFVVPLIFCGWRYLLAAAVLSVTLFSNLLYSLHYLNVMNAHLPGDPTNLLPILTRPMSLANVAIFFLLGYVFLGSTEETTVAASAASRKLAARADEAEERAPARSWFDPREGLATLRWPLDYLIAAALGVASFVLSFIRYTFPPEKYFDEIYFARAAEEYLRHQYIYENTHPPLTKLLITLSVMLFGGLAHGDTSAGWRFLDVLFGAFSVALLFIFAKRLTRSSLFAAIAASFLLFDGMHFVQSRIATPESFVCFFALATLYTFYRYWIASQTRTATVADWPRMRLRAIGTLLCLAGAIAAIWLKFHGESGAAKAVAIVYAFATLYLLFRVFIERRFASSAARFLSYAEGSTASIDGRNIVVHAPDGGVIDAASHSVEAGDLSRARRETLLLEDGELVATYRKDGSLEYATPLSVARYSPKATTIDDEPARFGDARVWLVLFAVSISALITSKWYGVMAYPATLGIIAFVWAQPRIAAFAKHWWSAPRGPARWGNPFGFPLDIVLAALVFIGGTMYFSAYTPQFVGLSDTPNQPSRAYSLTDVIDMQTLM
ncbi:MAG: phospholipid carrier-dependent glycosyltransferase, partial [Candidatus Eremiobacteraeota bacterium]|nr:phospholipid carrier-dependent glycosyltransferase [Candidatus Eremiobacteraeota bacterium]